MPRSVVQILTISAILWASGCSSYKIPNATIGSNTIERFENHYFADFDADYVYKASIEVYGNNLSGLVVIKRTSNTHHRVVFTTDFGNKLLDFSLSQEDFNVNFVVDGFDNKRLLSILENDFRLLLKMDFDIVQTLLSDGKTIYKSVQKRGNNTLFLTVLEEKLIQIINTSRTKEKITFEFHNNSNIFAEKIEVIHHNMPFKMQMVKM